jgi:hypothetical protein
LVLNRHIIGSQAQSALARKALAANRSDQELLLGDGDGELLAPLAPPASQNLAARARLHALAEAMRP